MTTTRREAMVADLSRCRKCGSNLCTLPKKVKTSLGVNREVPGVCKFEKYAKSRTDDGSDLSPFLDIPLENPRTDTKNVFLMRMKLMKVDKPPTPVLPVAPSVSKIGPEVNPKETASKLSDDQVIAFARQYDLLPDLRYKGRKTRLVNLRKKVRKQITGRRYENPFGPPLYEASIQLRCDVAPSNEANEHLVESGYLDDFESNQYDSIDSVLNYLGEKCGVKGCKGRLVWKPIRDASARKPPTKRSRASRKKRPPKPPT